MPLLPRAVLPACHPPLCCPDPPPSTAPTPMLLQHVPPGPCWGLAILRALPPTPVRGRAEGNTFLIVSFPFMGCQGAEAAAPHPFPLVRLCLFSFPPQPPLRTPTPPAPLMLCRWEQGGPRGPSPFLPWISCSLAMLGLLRGALPPSVECRESALLPPAASHLQRCFRGDQGSPSCLWEWAQTSQPVLGRLTAGAGPTHSRWRLLVRKAGKQLWSCALPGDRRNLSTIVDL